MDFTRRAYSVPCRFNRNSDAASVVRWCEVPESAPVLPYTSAILCKQQEPDDWLEGGVGEVAGAERTTTLARAPVGLTGNHICGSESDFNLGGLRDESLPPVEYGSLGFPLCCNPPLRVRGGAGASGRSVFVRRGPLAFRGGAACSGRSAYTVGSAAVPSEACADAPDITFGVTYAASHPGGSVAHWWFLPSASAFLCRFNATADPDELEGFIRGADCPNPAAFEGLSAGVCVTFGVFAPGVHVYITSASGDPFDYEFIVEAGACP